MLVLVFGVVCIDVTMSLANTVLEVVVVLQSMHMVLVYFAVILDLKIVLNGNWSSEVNS
jgi:hypothetical protein